MHVHATADQLAGRLPSLFPTSLVGSYAQPDWLIDRERLAGRFPPRVRARELWRPATRRTWRRPRTTRRWWRSGPRSAPGSTSSPTARSGVRATPTTSPPRWTASTSTTPGRRWTAAATPTRCRASSARSARPAPGAGARHRVPASATPIAPIKVTVPGPFTMSQQAQNDYYPDTESLAMAYAEACNAGGQGPLRGRRRHRAARRAVPAGAPGGGP